MRDHRELSRIPIAMMVTVISVSDRNAGLMHCRHQSDRIELDLGASREGRFEQMLRPPFPAARNGEGGGCLTAGSAQ